MDVRKYGKSRDFRKVLDVIEISLTGGELDNMPNPELRRYLGIHAERSPLCLVIEKVVGRARKLVGAALGYVMETEPGLVHLEVWEVDKKHGDLDGEAARQLLEAFLANVRMREIPGIRPEDTDNVQVKLFVPEGPRSEAAVNMGARVGRRWVECFWDVVPEN